MTAQGYEVNVAGEWWGYLVNWHQYRSERGIVKLCAELETSLTTHYVQFFVPAIPVPSTTEVSPSDFSLFEKGLGRIPVAPHWLELSRGLYSRIYSVNELLQSFNVSPWPRSARFSEKDTQRREPKASMTGFGRLSPTEDTNPVFSFLSKISAQLIREEPILHVGIPYTTSCSTR